MAPITHTSLESFLLLRTLHPYDRESFMPSFEQASDSLKNNDLLQQSGQLDAQRLDPDSLKDLYLSLLKEQARLEAATRYGSPSKGANPRKRKLSSPLLGNLDEALQYTHLLPQLVDRLYHQYQEDAIRSIKDEEHQYRTLQREIQALEHHTNDARAARPGSQGVPPISALLRETEESAQPHRKAPSVDSIVNGVTHSEAQVPFHESRNLHADIYRPLSQPGSAENGTPFLPPPIPPAQGYPLPSSGIDRRGSTNHGPSPSPRLNQTPLPQTDRSSASPIILPLPKGMVRSSGSPPGSLDALTDSAGKQYRANPPIPSPQQAHYPPPRPQSNQHLPNRHHTQSYSGYYDSQGYPMSYPSYSQSPVPIYHPHGGNMQPYHASAAHASHGSPYGANSYQSPLPSQHAAYYNAQGQYPQHMQTPYGQATPQYPDPRPPASNFPSKQRAAKPSPIMTSSSSTKWKKFDTSGFAHPPKSPIRPHSRDISPLSDVESSPIVEESATPEKRVRKTRLNRTQAQPDSQGLVSKDSNTIKPRGGRSRGTAPSGRGGRAGSVGSSTVAESSRRSHSVVDDPSIGFNIKPDPSTTFFYDDSASVASMNTADESSRKPARRRRETLRGLDAEQPPLNTKRKRDRGPGNSTLTPRPITPRPISKGQHLSPSPSVITPRRSPASKPGHVLATRNFPRITHTLLNDVTSHRLASLFAKPITERDAPGYKDLVLRPQDLKSIRAAINAGGRALTAALEEVGDDAGSGAHIWVPESEDLVPPKGIVNAGQLEKELMRIFANAVMFNPDITENRGLGPAFHTRQKRRGGTGGTFGDAASEGNQVGGEGMKFEIGVAAPVEGAVVQETRDVARDVQESFAAWRAVNRGGEDDIVVAGGTPMRLPGGTADSGGEDEDEEDEEDEEVKQSVEEEDERRSKRRRR